MAKKKNKKNVNKKTTNKVVEKVEVKKEEKIEVKKERKPLLNNTLVAILYLVCAVLWFISMVVNIIAKENYIIDLVVGILLVLASILYFYKAKKEK